jgi:hypothetical protein
VAGVRDVDNYLHLPGTLPPNKAEVLMAERAPAYTQPRETPTHYTRESPTT